MRSFFVYWYMDNLTFNQPAQFYLFLFVHAAYTDYQMHTKEVQYILDKLKTLVSDDMDVYEEFTDLKDQYDHMTNQSIEDTINQNFPRFLDDPLQQNLLNWLSGVIQADGVVKESELKFFSRVKETIQGSANH